MKTLSVQNLLVLLCLTSPVVVAAQGGIPVPRESNDELLITDLPQDLTGSVTSEQVFPQIEAPTGSRFTHFEPFPDGSGRFAVSTLTGIIWAIPDDPDPAPGDLLLFLDLETETCMVAEAGMASFAFDPEYAVSGHVYVCYTITGDNDCLDGSIPGAMWRLSRFTNPDPLDPDSPLDKNSEEVLIELEQYSNRHKGGSLHFGPDGMFYVTIGDSTERESAQDTTDLRGSIIRIDVHSAPDQGLLYRIPPDNPFYNGGPDGTDTRKEIFAYGFRNPWKASFDKLSGRFFVGDVGENTYEEVNVVVAGGNYGWPMYEGNDCFDGPCEPEGLTFPVGGYFHRPGNEAVIGGYVYFGSLIPHLYGVYLFADMDGDMYGLRALGDGTFEQFLVTPGIGYPLVGFGQDFDGEVYLLPSWTSDLSVRRLRAGGTPQPSSFPTRLSDLPALLTAAEGNGHLVEGVIPYEPSAKLWSDWTHKERYIAMPGLEQIIYRETGGWDFPEESVIIKNFLLPMDRRDMAGSLRRIETRLLYRKDDAWHGFTYEWNDTETDAVLLTDAKSRRYDIIDEEGEVHSQNWYFPSRNDCMSCHTSTSNFVLGPNTAQMNYDFFYPATAVTDNQLRAMDFASVFDAPLPDDPEFLPRMPDYTDTSQSLEMRARAYLAANCAMCHAPGGTAPTGMDLTWEAALVETRTIGYAPERGNLGIEGARIVDMGSPETSILLQRIKTLDSAHRMPPLATSEVDPAGVELIEEWILSLEPMRVRDGVWQQYH